SLDKVKTFSGMRGLMSASVDVTTLMNASVKERGMKRQINWTLMACIAIFTGEATLVEGSATGTVKPLCSVQFSPDSDVQCLSSAVEAGDPKTGRSTLILKASPRCVVP